MQGAVFMAAIHVSWLMCMVGGRTASTQDSSVLTMGIDLLTGKGCELRKAIRFEGRCFGASQLKWSVSLTTYSICSPAPVLILSQFSGVCVILKMALSIWLLD